MSRVYKHLHKKEGVKVNDIAAKFRADFEAGLTYWDTDPVNPYAHAYAKSFAGPASLGTAGRGLESVKLPQNHDEVPACNRMWNLYVHIFYDVCITYTARSR